MSTAMQEDISSEYFESIIKFFSEIFHSNKSDLLFSCYSGDAGLLKTKFESSELFCQQIHSLLKHKMLQLCTAPTCFGPFGPSSGSIRRNLAKVTVFVELLVKIHR
jgi:hypothetical protein